MDTVKEFSSGRRNAAVNSQNLPKNLHRSIFELPSGFFDSCRLLEYPSTSSTAFIPELATTATISNEQTLREDEVTDLTNDINVSLSDRLTCNTCKSSFESLHDQRSHFKSDFHRFNVYSINLIMNFVIIMFFLLEYVLVMHNCYLSL